jgi:hypothetical protein
LQSRFHFSTRLNSCAAEDDPPLPEQVTVIVTVEAPAFAAALPVNASVRLMLPEVAVFTLLMEGVIPAGSPPSMNEPSGINPPDALTVSVIAPALV